MEFSNDRFVFKLEQSELPMFFFTLIVEDKRDYSIYKGEFDMHIVTDDIASFDALMKKFFDGKYDFRVDPYENGLELSFKIIIEDIVLKQFKLQVPIFHKLTEREEHAARILQLENNAEEYVDRILDLENKIESMENEIESMQKQIERFNMYVEFVSPNPDEDIMFCQFFSYDGGQFKQFAKRGAETITLDFNQKFRSTLIDRMYEIYKKGYKLSTQIGSFPCLQEFEVLHFNDDVYPDEEVFNLYFHNSLKRIKITNCPNLKKFDISPRWWKTKTLIVENCPSYDFEYFFDGIQRSITTIILADKSDRLMQRYSRRFEEIGICLRF
jgi:hypothetical protein